MEQYIFIKMKPFESMSKFQVRINDQARKGYTAINVTGQHGGFVVLMEKRN
jgi:hypothetical protein